MATVMTISALNASASSLQRELEDLLNAEERAMEEDLEEIEDLKTELVERSMKLETESRQKIRKEQNGVDYQHRRHIVKVRDGENEVVPSRLPKTPKPPERVQKVTRPTPAGPIRVVYPTVVPDKIEFQPPKPKYVWDGEKFIRVPPAMLAE